MVPSVTPAQGNAQAPRVCPQPAQTIHPKKSPQPAFQQQAQLPQSPVQRQHVSNNSRLSMGSMPSLGQSMERGNSNSMGHSGYQDPTQVSQSSQNSNGYNPYSFSGGGNKSMPSLLYSSSEREAPTPLKQIDRSRRKTESGKTIVTTPWYPQGTMKDEIKLGDEVNQLGRLLKLTHREINIRNRCRSTIQDIARVLWPGVTVKVYGSFAYGLSLPTSALDLVCEGCTDLSGNMDAFVKKVQELGLSVEGKYVNETGQEGFALIKAGEVTAYLALVAQKSRARQSVALMRELLQTFPYATPVFAVVRLLLQQSRCNDAREGGLSSYALLVMVFHVCYTTSPKDAGQLLVSFLKEFGTATDGVIVCAKQQAEKRYTPEKTTLWVEDPLEPTNNLAAGFLRGVQMRSVFQTSSMTLQKWMSQKWSGYRGRTPLSSILAYGDMWDRAAAKEEEKEHQQLKQQQMLAEKASAEQAAQPAQPASPVQDVPEPTPPAEAQPQPQPQPQPQAPPQVQAEA